MNPILQRPAESRKLNSHNFAIRKLDACAEAERIGSQKVDMRVARAEVAGVLEMVVLQIFERVRHPRFATGDFLRPNPPPAAPDAGKSQDKIEPRIDNQFRPDCTGALFRRCQIEIIQLLQAMIGKFIRRRISAAESHKPPVDGREAASGVGLRQYFRGPRRL